jgi:hypothetical protein
VGPSERQLWDRPCASCGTTFRGPPVPDPQPVPRRHRLERIGERRCPFGEVGVFEVREVLRLWLGGGKGLRSIE